MKPVMRRAGWGVADQALSSVTNFALAILVARHVGAREFGAFGLVFATYTVFLGVGRALASEPLAVRFSGTSQDRWRSALSQASALTALCGVAAAVICGAIALGSSGATSRSFLALAVVLPGLLLQDVYRLSFFVIDRGKQACVIDLVWGIAMTIGLGLALPAGANSAPAFILLWGAGAAVAAVDGARRAGTLPVIGGAGAWWAAHRDLAARYVGEFMAMFGGGHLALYAVGAAAGLAAVGALRGGQVLLGPLNIVFMGAALVAIPEGARLLRRSRAALVRGCTMLALLLASIAAACGGLLVLLPEEAGSELLGPSWEAARATVVPLTAWFVASAAVAGPAVGLRVMAHARRSLRLRLVVSLGAVAGALVGAAVAGAPGAAWGLAAATALGAGAWWRDLLRTDQALAAAVS